MIVAGKGKATIFDRAEMDGRANVVLCKDGSVKSMARAPDVNKRLDIVHRPSLLRFSLNT